MDLAEGCEVQIAVFDSIDGGLRGDIRAFLRSLDEERRTFVTRLERILRSEIVVTARVEGRLVGLVGVTRRFLLVPFRYAVVGGEFQGRGVAKILYEKELPRLRRYFCVFSIIMNENERGLEWSRSRGDVVICRDDRFTYVCNSWNSLYSRICARVLRPIIPAALALKLTWDRIRDG